MNSRNTFSEVRRPYLAGKQNSWQPLRILVVEAVPPFWANTCSKLCEALDNLFCLACSLAGPCRIPLLSLYVVQNQHECLLPFVQVKESFARLQTCLSELRSLPREGSFQLKREGVMQAVQDGLQQFKQYTRHLTAGSSVNSSVEITVVTSQAGAEMVKQLEAGLRDVDLVCLRRLQVIEISRGDVPEAMDVEWSAQAVDEASSNDSSILGMDIDLQTLKNDVVSLETFFKTWLHDHSTDREQLLLLLPAAGTAHCAAPRTSLVCVKCDIQERILSPALLPQAANITMRMDDLSTPLQLAAGPSASPYRLRAIKTLSGAQNWMQYSSCGLTKAEYSGRMTFWVLFKMHRALKREGVCESMLYGLPFIIKPTSCWQLDWDELEMNQHHFHALCHSLLKWDWMLLAEHEPQSASPSWSIVATSYYAVIPSDSSTLLLRAIAVRELLLPCVFPALNAELPEAAMSTIESALSSLELEPIYNPLRMRSNLYKQLRGELSRPLHWQLAQHRSRERHPPRQPPSRQPPSKARATVAPLPMAVPVPKVLRTSVARKDPCELSLFSDEDDQA